MVIIAIIGAEFLIWVNFGVFSFGGQFDTTDQNRLA